MSDLDKILADAQDDRNILAVGTEGARNDGAVPSDKWTDLDVTLFTADPVATDGMAVLRQIGAPIIVQHLEQTGLFGDDAFWRIWLTRFAGTKRVDLKIVAADAEAAYLTGDSLNAIVWRRGIGAVQPRATSAATHEVPVPTQIEFADVVNELYWCAGNVVKGIGRANLLYANEQLNQYVRPQLLQLLAWRETMRQGGHFDAGVSGKFTWQALTRSERQELAATYDQADLMALRRSVVLLLDLTQRVLADFAHDGRLLVPDYVDAADMQLRELLAR
ncbi:aminoglycoside 6-adenylyltransferase [Lacticaseibacillus songhuajiangensis]|uniref:aminoglycoside 6-adenylyltransferase n=1 Tax=Lacticaseibacillus songhuajiangensis TaxID=1296539 RepID=UPI0013DE27C9|nr:aminoglycoside 6-adenylyltransferase [Lacticaseibacillus songhuajiangensis]